MESAVRGNGATRMTLVFRFGFSLKAIRRPPAPLLLPEEDLDKHQTNIIVFIVLKLCCRSLRDEGYGRTDRLARHATRRRLRNHRSVPVPEQDETPLGPAWRRVVFMLK